MKRLKKYNQEHLLNYYNELNNYDKFILKQELKKVNLKKMYKLYLNSYQDERINLKKISPLKVIKKNNTYQEKGIDLIKKGEYAVVIMAGGNGSRLGFDGPKGCLELNIDNKFISLFEIYINQLKEIIKDYNVVIPIYIMTSSINHEETINFFKIKNYFNYPKDHINIFKQSNLPILDINGRLVLKDKNHLLFGPNGNGDVFVSLRKNKYIRDMKKNNIKYSLFINVDNILNDLVDFNFIGTTLCNNYKIASKTLKLNKKKEWIFCKYKNHPFMLPSEFLNNKILINDRYKNISYHLISTKLVEKFSKKRLKYHRAYKKSKYLNSLNKLNSFKFEKFIFDAFYFSKDMLLYETNEDDFYPIKRIDDIKKAVENYKKKKFSN